MRLHHVALICSDYQRSKQFYTEILGLTVLAEHYREARQSWKLDLGIGGHYVLELFSFPNPPERLTRPEACGLRHLAFSVENLAEKHIELSEKGVVCEAVRIDEYTGKAFFFIFDPDNLPVEFYQE
ncbi:SMU1112c/YaeR family gloxylase I-like metalloprotein [Neisseria canis]|uniref:Putative lyase n=1 Tax=Neisseria canis TaxID=493 RepID=A0A448D833_9NEIS|nr:VOC family protein [Neisseria canis]OSI12177.1 hypothetical protein BWD07_06880 [Neisseria canis]VEF01258.1 putative lyase [Neisseria canis]